MGRGVCVCVVGCTELGWVLGWCLGEVGWDGVVWGQFNRLNLALPPPPLPEMGTPAAEREE